VEIAAMGKAKAVKNKLAGKAKRVAGEVLGDQKLDEEGRAQEQEGQEEDQQSASLKPLGNLDRLT
jgi:uncharacterized protein YjbJ (UPF0337 family)